MDRKKWMKRGIMIAGAICAVVALAFALASLYIRAPEIGQDKLETTKKPDSNNEQTETEPDDEITQDPDDNPGEGSKGELGKEPVQIQSDRRPGVYTILLVGTSDDYTTDTLMVCSIDTERNSVNVISIPRDTKVEASRYLKKINGALGFGGISLLRKEVTSLLGFEPDFTVKIGLKGLISLVDAIGGVDFDIPYKMNYDDPSQDLHIHFKPGLQHLDGQAAMEMVRYRGHAGSDFSRMKIQQEFLMVVAKKVLTPQNIGKIDTFAKIYAENVETDLSVGNLIWLGLRGYEIGSENIRMETLPTYTKDADVNPSYYQFVNSKEALRLINETINPYEDKITEEHVNHVPFVAPASQTLEASDEAPGA